MKLLFTADLHIKLGQKNVPVVWARNRFKLFLEQFADMQKQANLVIIGGDIFDKLPSMDEIELYFDLVSSIKLPCVIYAGNHEAIKKDTTFLSYLAKSTNQINPLVTICDTYRSDILGGDLDIIPYNKLRDFLDNYGTLDFNGRILCTHVRGEIPPHVKPEINLDLLNKWQVVLAGDLHSYENSQRNILYPGSPYTTSFHRNEVDTGAILLDIDSLDHHWLKFKLPQLIKRTILADEKPEPTTFHHTIYEVEGSLHELGSMDSSELIGKKVVKRSNDSRLILDNSLTLGEEVREYLTYILELSEQDIENTMKEFYANAAKIETT